MSAESFERCNQILKHIMGDTSVPRNIRRAVRNLKFLSQDMTEPLLEPSSNFFLDEISNDPNIPIHAVNTYLECLSELESVRE